MARGLPRLVDSALRGIAERPLGTLTLLGAITALSLALLIDFGSCRRDGAVSLAACRLTLELDASFNRILPHEGPLWESYEEFRAAFGTDEQVIVALHFPGSVYSPEAIDAIDRVTVALEALPKVQGTPLSLTSARHAVRREGQFPETVYVVEEIPPDPEDIPKIRSVVEGHSIYAGALVGADARTATVVVDFLRLSDREYIDGEISRRIRELAEREAGAGVEVWIAGGLHLKDAQYRAQLEGLLRSSVLAILVLAAVLAYSFRSARGVVLPLTSVVLALVWTLALAAALGQPLNLVTVLLPPLLLILGVSYAVHVVSEYGDVASERDPSEPKTKAVRATVVYEALRQVYRPVVLTGFTTAIGFLAMLVQEIEALREFGLLALVGVLLTVVVSLSFPPAVLALLPLRGRRKRGGGDVITRLAELAARLSRDYRRPILIGVGVVMLLAIPAILALEVGAGGVESFPESSRVRTDYEAINEGFGGASTLNVVVRSPVHGAMRDPEPLRWIAGLQDWLEAQPEIGRSTSMVEHLVLCNRAVHGEAELPETPERTGELLIMCRPTLRGYVTNDRRYTQISAQTTVSDMGDYIELLDRIRARLAAGQASDDEPATEGKLPSYFAADITGNPVLTTDLVDRLVRGQVLSILGAVILIYAVLALQFASPLTGLVALVPNVLPIAAYFAALGATGTPLNPTTAVIAPMALGIAIDDTIHYMTRFTEECRRTLDEGEAVESALISVGRPVTYTTVALCAGFLVFTTGPLVNHVQLGALGAFTLGCAWLAEFAVTPAICSGVRVISIWETLTLDLGHDPQTEMPSVFAGLSNRQSRIVALVSSLEAHEPGTRLMQLGEPGTDMLLIVDGTVRVRTAEGNEIKFGRGQILGEIGCFLPGGERTASAWAEDDVRLLRISRASLEGLRARNPRIAARVFLNLNVFQAKRFLELEGRQRQSRGEAPAF